MDYEARDQRPRRRGKSRRRQARERRIARRADTLKTHENESDALLPDHDRNGKRRSAAGPYSSTGIHESQSPASSQDEGSTSIGDEPREAREEWNGNNVAQLPRLSKAFARKRNKRQLTRRRKYDHFSKWNAFEDSPDLCNSDDNEDHFAWEIHREREKIDYCPGCSHRCEVCGYHFEHEVFGAPTWPLHCVVCRDRLCGGCTAFRCTQPGCPEVVCHRCVVNENLEELATLRCPCAASSVLERESTSSPSLHERESIRSPSLHERESTSSPSLHERESTSSPSLHERESTNSPSPHERVSIRSPSLHERESICSSSLYERELILHWREHGIQTWENACTYSCGRSLSRDGSARNRALDRLETLFEKHKHKLEGEFKERFKRAIAADTADKERQAAEKAAAKARRAAKWRAWVESRPARLEAAKAQFAARNAAARRQIEETGWVRPRPQQRPQLEAQPQPQPQPQSASEVRNVVHHETANIDIGDGSSGKASAGSLPPPGESSKSIVTAPQEPSSPDKSSAVASHLLQREPLVAENLQQSKGSLGVGDATPVEKFSVVSNSPLSEEQTMAAASSPDDTLPQQKKSLDSASRRPSLVFRQAISCRSCSLTLDMGEFTRSSRRMANPACRRCVAASRKQKTGAPFNVVGLHATAYILQFLTMYGQARLARVARMFASAARISLALPGPLECAPRGFIPAELKHPAMRYAFRGANVSGVSETEEIHRLLRIRTQPTKILVSKPIQVANDLCEPREDYLFNPHRRRRNTCTYRTARDLDRLYPGWREPHSYGDPYTLSPHAALSLRVLSDYPSVAQTLTRLSLRHDNANREEWASCDALAFLNLTSLNIEHMYTPKFPNNEIDFVKPLRALGSQNLEELAIVLSRTSGLGTRHVSPDDRRVLNEMTFHMNEEETQLFSRYAKLERLTLRLGIAVPVVAALAAALPRSLKELAVESVIVDVGFMNWNLTRLIFLVDDEQMRSIVDALPSGLRALSLPVTPDSQEYFFRRFPLHDGGMCDLEDLAHGRRCPPEETLRALELSVACGSLVSDESEPLSLARGLAKCANLETLSLEFHNTWKDILDCHLSRFRLPTLGKLHTLTITSIGDAPQLSLLESLASLPALNTLRFFFGKRIGVSSSELARAMSRISLRTLHSDATTLSVGKLRAILRVSPRLQYVNIETRRWQQVEYTRFVKFLAHGRHACVGHDDPLGEENEKWHEQFFYVVTREAPCGEHGRRDYMIRNVNGLERAGGHTRLEYSDYGSWGTMVSSVTGGFEEFGC